VQQKKSSVYVIPANAVSNKTYNAVPNWGEALIQCKLGWGTKPGNISTSNQIKIEKL
jgi:hypothetical protein